MLNDAVSDLVPVVSGSLEHCCQVLKGMGKRCKKTGEPIDILTNFADYNLKARR